MAPVTLATQGIRCQACSPPARPPSLPPSSWCGLLQPDVQMLLRPPFQLQAGGNREPYWEETTILLCAVTKYLLVSEGRPSCIPS